MLKCLRVLGKSLITGSNVKHREPQLWIVQLCSRHSHLVGKVAPNVSLYPHTSKTA